MATPVIFPTPYQMADMLRACVEYEGVQISVEEETDSSYWIAVEWINDIGSYYDGFYYEYANPVEGYPWAARRFAEIVCDLWDYIAQTV